MNARNLAGLVGAMAALLLLAAPAGAQEKVYRPLNPAFGGNPMNYSWMLSSAQAQKKQPDALSRLARDPLEDFAQGLQRQVLSALSRELDYNRFGRDIDLSKEGVFDLGDFMIEIVPGLNGVDIRITNALTGDQSLITVPYF
jgi:curli production assembly/transport component CsgF